MNNEEKFERIVSEALEKEPAFELPYDFADRVVLKIQQQAVERDAQKDKWWLITGVVAMVGAMIFAFTQVTFKPGVGVFTFFKGYAGLVIFGILFVIALHIIDKRVIARRSHR
jgi:hypothetical protein